MGFIDCCSNILLLFPDPSLPFLPALCLGTVFAALILLYLYKKETNLPLSDILLHMIRSVLINFPLSGSSTGHSEADQCNNPQCVRCQKYEELQRQIGERWKRWRKRAGSPSLERVEQAVQRLERKGRKERTGNLVKQGKIVEEENVIEEKEEGKVKYRGKQGKQEAEKESKTDGEGKESKETKKGKEQGKQKSYQNPTVFHMNLAANPYWKEYDVHVNEQKLLKLNFELILQEFEKVFGNLQSGDTSGWKNNAIPQGHWCIFPFVDQGTIVTANCRRCPGVAEMILGCLPAMMNDCVFGNAAFSILYPDSHITPHCGPTNLRLRCHLGLKIPGGCWIEVAGKQYKWAVGETFLFDDSFMHSVHFTNQPSSAHSEPRAILLLDFWHPDVTDQEKDSLLELLAPLE